MPRKKKLNTNQRIEKIMENPEKATSPDTTFIAQDLTPKTIIEKIVVYWKSLPSWVRALAYNAVGAILTLVARDLLLIQTNEYGTIILHSMSTFCTYLVQEVISKRASENMINRLNEK